MDGFGVGSVAPQLHPWYVPQFVCCVLSTNTLAGELGKAKFSEKLTEVLGGRLFCSDG